MIHFLVAIYNIFERKKVKVSAWSIRRGMPRVLSRRHWPHPLPSLLFEHMQTIHVKSRSDSTDK